MAIATGQIIQTRPTGAAASLVTSFLDRNVNAGTAGNYNDGIRFSATTLPVQTMPAGAARTAAEAYYTGLNLFAGTNAGLASGITDNNFPTNPSLIAATDGNYLSTTGYSQVFLTETNRYVIFRNISATTVVTGNIPPAGTYSESGKAYVTAANAFAAIVNPASAANFLATRVVSASTNGTIGGAAATALNTYWDELKAAWATNLNNAGTYTIPTFTTCHGSCHSSCHGSRGRR